MNTFYNYLKHKTKPKYMRLAQEYVELYQFIKTLNPLSTENYLKVLDESTKKLKDYERQIEENAGIAIAGMVSYKNKALKKFIKKK